MIMIMTIMNITVYQFIFNSKSILEQFYSDVVDIGGDIDALEIFLFPQWIQPQHVTKTTNKTTNM